MFDKLRRKLRTVFDDDSPMESLTRAVEKMGSCSINVCEQNFGKKQYANSTFVPLQAETYDPKMIPSPSQPPSSASTPENARDEEDRNIFEHQPANFTEAMCDLLESSKMGLDLLRSTSAKQIEHKVFSRHAENKVMSAFPEFFYDGEAQLIARFQCTVLHGRRPLVASIYVTKQCVFLVSKPFQEVPLAGGDFYPKVVKRENSKNGAQRVKEAIEINEIVSICRCIAVKKMNSADIDAARTMSLLPLPDPGVEYNTIVLYLQDSRRIVISDVKLNKSQSMCRRLCAKTRGSKSTSPIERLYTSIDDLWRRSCVVPYPNVQYNEDSINVP